MNAQKLLISQQNNILFIEPDKIIYLQSDNCYTTIFIQGSKKVIVCKPLSKLQHELEPLIFIRVSQSFVINKYLIERIDKKKKSIDLKENHSIGYTVPLKNLLTMINQS